MRALSLGQDLEVALLRLGQPQVFERRPALARQLLQTLRSRLREAEDNILLTCPELRPALSQLTRASLPRLRVLSRQDIPPGTLVETLPLSGAV